MPQPKTSLWVLGIICYVLAHVSFVFASLNFWFGSWVLFILVPALTTFFSCRLISMKARHRSLGGMIWLLVLSFFGYCTALIASIVMVFLLSIGVGYMMTFLGVSFLEADGAVESTQPLEGFSSFFMLVLSNYLTFAICSLFLFFKGRGTR